ncbi:MAG: ABC transporter permease subunit [Mesorhizobium sp.]|nr:MAG: ABC transporter permease subunit [Mesorhizobium sp.]
MSIGSYTVRAGAKVGENDGLSVPWSRPRRKRTGVSARLISALTILALLAAWTVSAELQLVSPVFLPSPAAVWAKFVVVARDGFVDATLLQHVTASLWRVFAALIVAIVVGVLVGLAIGISRIGRGVFDPLLEFLRPIPPLAYLPLIVIWFGIGEPSKILVIAIAMLAPVALSTAAGVRGVSRERIDAARSLGATRRQVVRHVILPSALPSILTGLRIALGAGWSTLVAAELVAATRGLGFMIQSAAQFLVTDVVVMGILVIATIAFALEFVIRRIERALVPWAGRD